MDKRNKKVIESLQYLGLLGDVSDLGLPYAELEIRCEYILKSWPPMTNPEVLQHGHKRQTISLKHNDR